MEADNVNCQLPFVFRSEAFRLSFFVFRLSFKTRRFRRLHRCRHHPVLGQV